MSNNEEKDLDKKDFIEETVIIEEAKENKESKEEINNEEYINNDEELGLDDNPSFFKTLFASIVDQAIILGVSAIALVAFDFLIGFIGFMVADATPVLLIIYVILNVIYGTVVERKNRRSLGKRILNIA